MKFRVGKTVTLTPREAFGDAWVEREAQQPAPDVKLRVTHIDRDSITLNVEPCEADRAQPARLGEGAP